MIKHRAWTEAAPDADAQSVPSPLPLREARHFPALGKVSVSSGLQMRPISNMLRMLMFPLKTVT